MKKPTIVVLALVMVSSACDVFEPVACTLEARAGISVGVFDAISAESITDGSTMTLREGDFVETSTGAIGDRLVGAYERAGTYHVAVAREGYHIWIRADVRVTADECHVRPVVLRADMQKVSTP